MQQLPPGTRLGPYLVQDVIGHGGMATVYRARQDSLGRQVALKVLHPSLAADPAFVERFRREATTAASLEHLHIVPIYDVGESEGWQYIAMRYLAGGTLKDLLDRGALSSAQSIQLLAQIGSALDYAHALGVVHRDLKPANVLVSPDGRHASLTDFGIARAGDASGLTRMGTIAGTPEYMSPEQSQGSAVDGRSDLYALGIVAFEMFGGRVPFQADSAFAVLHQQIHSTPPRLRSVRPDTPTAVDQAVARMLAKRPEQRYRSAAEFVSALAAGGSGATVAFSTRKGSALIRWTPLAAAAIGLVIVASIAVVLRPGGQAGADAAPAMEVLNTPVPPPTVTAVPAVVASPTTPPSPTAVPSPTSPPPTPTAAPSPTPVPAAPPSLARFDFAPNTVKPGDAITLHYEVSNPGAAPVQVTLGASIRSISGGGTIDDPTDDEAVMVAPGRGVYQRTFRLPVRTAPGKYDVLWGLIGSVGESLGLEVQSGALTVSAPVVVAAPTNAPRAAPSSAPADTVRQYYLLIGAGDYQSARGLQSQRLQNSLNYSNWVAGFATTSSVSVPSVSTLSQTSSTASVSVTVVSVDVDSSGNRVRKTFQGTWGMVYSGGGWKLDSANLKQTS